MTSKHPDSENSDTLYLVDGSSYLYRAFHALPSLTNNRGEATGAIYGVANMLRRLLKESSPLRAAVVFDAKGKTFRHEQYAEYKANRPPMPDELREQLEGLKMLVRTMGFPLLEVSGVEADDVIGTLCEEAAKQGISCVVSTGDKDLAQLVNAGDKTSVTLVDTMKNAVLTPAAVVEKFGVSPAQIIDYLALVGDSSDNIPGVPKVGPKTAVKWLQQYGSVDEIIAHAEEFKGKVGENLREFLPQLPLSRELTTIKLDVPLDVSADKLFMQPVNEKDLLEILQRYDFHRWADELGRDGDAGPGADSPAVKTSYTTIFNTESLKHWLQKLGSAELFAFDTETTSLNYMQAEIVGLSFAVTANEAAYLPLAHNYPGCPQQLDRDEVLQRFKPLLEDPNKAKLGQHLKYDRNVLLNHGIELNGISHDTMLESYVLDSTGGRHDMDSLARRNLGRDTIKFSDVAGKGKNQLTFDQVEIENAGPYAAEDADITLQLHQHLWPQLQQLPSLEKLYQELEIPLIPVLSRMETTGVLIDGALLRKQSQELAKKMLAQEQRAYELAGHNFNLASPKQLQHILFEELELPIIRKTPKGQPSTAEDVLTELGQDYELPRLILDYRSTSKLKSTYTDTLPERIDSHSGRVHTSYHQAVAATGRLSSSEPNLQNIPVRTAEGRRIREAFIAPPGRVILACDYSQIELRIMAHLSADKTLLDAFHNDLDIHSATAAEVFAVGLDKVSTDQRRAAKAINFGLMYGMSAFGLAKQLDIKRGDAQEYIDTYFSRYPGVFEFMEKTRELARQQQYVETLFGRRLWLREINARNPMRRQAAERAAINAPMQGTAADIIKRAMLSVDAWMQAENPEALMIMQVHDELVFEVAEDQLEDFTKEVITRMEAAAELSVPLKVDSDFGANWEAAH
ncbi:MAG: DNA polymerase I [Proteobacteria bacterium]|nr:DNA polymerase I [Pseudomonadota bacterium]